MLRNDIGFPTVNRTIYCLKFLTLSSQASRYIRKCITVLQPGFKKGRVHIIKRALSSHEAASGESVGGGIPLPLGGGMGDLPQENI